MYYDIKVPLDAVTLLDKEDSRRIDTIRILNDCINLLDLRKPYSESFYQSVEEAIAFLQREFYAKSCGNASITATCIGHTHIDVAWLWTLAQTREKTVRSFSTVLNLMKSYPEYVFMSSQPQLYQYIKEDQPEIYAQMKERVKEGRWEPEGAMWLEADCNLSSGESLVRQILFGTRFFKEEFGVENKILWLPDVFGYSAALPQILKKSGIDYFMTTKISWNEYNKMPYDTFMWKGMDGTEILTHFISTTNYSEVSKSHGTSYNGVINPDQIMGAWQRYQQKNINHDVLVCFGYGDGGGGPTKEMLENARRLEKGIPGCPQVKIGKAVDYFKKLEDTVTGSGRLPKWVGELYLEYHRGTYTSMARNKKYNRKSEFLFQDVELFSAMSKHAASGYYPQSEINKCWETILLNQFHDILPGSSIKEVYEDSRAQYEKIAAKGQNLLNDCLDNIAGKISVPVPSVIVFNQLGWNRSDMVELTLPHGAESAGIRDLEGKLLPAQTLQGGKVLFYAENVPSKGYKAFTVEEAKSAPKVTSAFDQTFENDYFRITFDTACSMTSIFDKTNNRELLKPGERANVLQAFEDKPHNYDAWDINIYYQEKMWEINDVVKVELTEDGPVRKTLRIERKFLDSWIAQDIQLYTQIPRIDFKTTIDWKEKHVLLKAAFPVDIHTEKASFEIQYGNVERPTHWNTSWDTAKFEVCAHKWADLSEDAYGVSLLNDCKYGHDIKDGLMRLTLLKSATWPNEDADRERHEFTYSLYPHAGGFREAGTVQMAYELNCPMYAAYRDANDGTLPHELSFAHVDKENVILEVVKKAEDSEDLIVRLYECYNRRTTATLGVYGKVTEVYECDLMEQPLHFVPTKSSSFTFEIKPYEIKTFKIKA